MAKTKKIDMRVTESLWHRLNEMAKADNKSRSQIIIDILIDYFTIKD